MDSLRAACGRALQAQRGITAYFQPAVGSHGNLGVEVAAQVGGVAVLVSDSESAVEPCQTTVHKRHAKKHAKRYHLDFTVRAAANAQRKKSSQQGAQGSERLVVPKSARADRTGVLVREGSWKRTADESARLCQQDGPSHLPPCYAGLHQEHQRWLTSEMYGCLEEVQWATCVVCGPVSVSNANTRPPRVIAT